LQRQDLSGILADFEQFLGLTNLNFYSAALVEEQKDLKAIMEVVGKQREALADNFMYELKRLYRYLETVPDSDVKLILTLRHAHFLTWRQIADCIGGGLTAEDVRKMHDRYCAKHKKLVAREQNKSNSKIYTYRWRKAGKAYLKENPLCVHCQRDGRLTPATEVDHIIPHNGDLKLFWDRSNWQALCKKCHSVKTAAEDGGFGNAIK